MSKRIMYICWIAMFLIMIVSLCYGEDLDYFNIEDVKAEMIKLANDGYAIPFNPEAVYIKKALNSMGIYTKAQAKKLFEDLIKEKDQPLTLKDLLGFQRSKR